MNSVRLIRFGAAVLALLMLFVLLSGLSDSFDLVCRSGLRYAGLVGEDAASASLSGLSAVDCQEARFVSVTSAINFERNDIHIGAGFRLMLCIVYMLAVLGAAAVREKDKPRHLTVRLQI